MTWIIGAAATLGYAVGGRPILNFALFAKFRVGILSRWPTLKIPTWASHFPFRAMATFEGLSFEAE